jgi:HAD superfamily hydrolase (TIGR01549 family)
MISAILFDLDDTLLGNNMDTFMPGYFSLIGAHAQPVMADSEKFLRELMVCTEAAIANTDPELSNREVFWQVFQQRNGLDPAELEPFFDQFYREEFPKLQEVTVKRPAAAKLVQFAFDRGLKVVVATNPLFPRLAVEQRLAWAGVPVTDYAFDLVTTYENMHSAKPHQSYYEEILDEIDVPPARALMVGDDWEQDIEPAAALGMYTYWLPGEETAVPDPDLVDAYGPLDHLYQRFQQGWLEELD